MQIQSESPFEELAHGGPLSPFAARQQLLEDAIRPLVPLRHGLVQNQRGAAKRPSVLADLVRTRHERALDTALMLYALEPILEGTPLANETWARVVSTWPSEAPLPRYEDKAAGHTGDSLLPDAPGSNAIAPRERPPITAAAMSKLWAILAGSPFWLITKGKRLRKMPVILPLSEDGQRQPYTRPGATAKGTIGYFNLPIQYWTDGWHDVLDLPAKAMLLIHLAGTSNRQTLDMSYRQCSEWYGVSEATAKRGVEGLTQWGLMKEWVQQISNAHSPTGSTFRHHRFLTGPFSHSGRLEIQRKNQKALRRSGSGLNAAFDASGQNSPRGGESDAKTSSKT